MKSSAGSKNIKPSDHPTPSGRTKKRVPKPPKRVTAEWLRNSGLYYLQRFATSTAHFRTIMARKIDRSCHAHPDQNRDECLRLLDDMIVDFTRQALLNDQTYAEGTITSLRRRGLSRRAISMRLRSKGLDHESIATLLSSHDTEQGLAPHEDGDFQAALKLARRKRIGPYSTPGKEKDVDKAIAALGRAGFSYDIARRVIHMRSDDLDL